MRTSFADIDHERNVELLDAASHCLLHAETPRHKAYFRGYVSGISMRIAGSMDRNAPGAVAFEYMLDDVDEEIRAVGRGYRDGLEGKVIEMGELNGQRERMT